MNTPLVVFCLRICYFIDLWTKNNKNINQLSEIRVGVLHKKLHNYYNFIDYDDRNAYDKIFVIKTEAIKRIIFIFK